MNIIEKIKLDHAKAKARREELLLAEDVRVAKDLAHRAAPIKKRLESAIANEVLAEEFGSDAAAVFAAFNVEHEADADLLNEKCASSVTVRLLRDGLAPIMVDLGRDDLKPVSRSKPYYGDEFAGIWQVCGLTTSVGGNVVEDDDFDTIGICASFAEAVI